MHPAGHLYRPPRPLRLSVPTPHGPVRVYRPDTVAVTVYRVKRSFVHAGYRMEPGDLVAREHRHERYARTSAASMTGGPRLGTWRIDGERLIVPGLDVPIEAPARCPHCGKSLGGLP